MTRHGKIPDWYDKDSEFEELFTKDTVNERITNRTIENILKKYRVKSVLDLTCGTGSQVFYLLKRGYKVVGSDISKGMLNIAKRKAKQQKINIKFLHGDMRRIKVGKFDAAISIFNAIGHLTKAGFEKAMRNIYSNLNNGGIYIFDIINLDYVLYKNNITKMSLERIINQDNTTYREIQHSTIDQTGVLTSFTTFYTQEGMQKPIVSKNTITLQLYTADQLKKMLAKNGFKVLHQCAIDGAKFLARTSDRIVTVAQKSHDSES